MCAALRCTGEDVQGRCHGLQYLHLAQLALLGPLQLPSAAAAGTSASGADLPASAGLVVQGVTPRQQQLLQVLPSWQWWALRWVRGRVLVPRVCSFVLAHILEAWKGCKLVLKAPLLAASLLAAR